MARNFSGALMVMDLDDFITPAQSCIVPLQELKGGKIDLGGAVPMENPTDRAAQKAAPPIAERGAIGFEGLPTTGWSQTRLVDSSAGDGGNAVKVTLSDCLACSGCVTSAETVLMTQQSGDQFCTMMARIRGETVPLGDEPEPEVLPRVAVVSLSPQSRASLAVAYGLTAAQTHRKLTSFFQGLGVHHVTDTSFSRELALLAAQREFVAAFRAAEAGGKAPGKKQRAPVTIGMEVEGEAKVADAMALEGAAAAESGTGLPQLPILGSSCPGWVCYAEKSHPLTLPHISRVKSPQALMGSLVKRQLARAMGLSTAAEVYHVSVMPCFDKKLEGSRSQLTVTEPLPDGESARVTAEVDCVLTTSEVAEMLTAQGLGPPEAEAAPPAAGGLAELEEAALSSGTVFTSWVDGDTSGDASGGGLAANMEGDQGSGGYLEGIFRYAALELFGVRLDPAEELPYRNQRNADYREVELMVDGKAVLRFASVYGFRNIQTLTRKLKRGQATYQYVEVMSCPSGCNNGGGQMRPPATGKEAALRRLAEVTETYQYGAITSEATTQEGGMSAPPPVIEDSGFSMGSLAMLGSEVDAIQEVVEAEGAAASQTARLAQAERLGRLGGGDSTENARSLAHPAHSPELLVQPKPSAGHGLGGLTAGARKLMSEALGLPSELVPGAGEAEALDAVLFAGDGADDWWRTSYTAVESQGAKNPLAIQW